MQILMVDNDRRSLEKHREFMTALGHKVDCSLTLDLAIKKLSNSYFDVSFVDENVIRQRNRHFIKELKNVNSKLPIIITSDNVSINSLLQLLKFQPFDIIQKPLSLHTLLFMQLLATDRAP